uniref:Septin 8 n=1 Tax=Sus scrofa TaxID=9823 RepID=A0A8D2C2I1_PIG
MRGKRQEGQPRLVSSLWRRPRGWGANPPPEDSALLAAPGPVAQPALRGGQGSAAWGISEVPRTPWGPGEGVSHRHPDRDPRETLSVSSEKAGGQLAWLGALPPLRRLPPACLPAYDGAPCSYRPIVDYIDAQFENYLQEELKIRRSLFDYHDTRIHVCLYFITPTGHSLKSLDLVTMKKLDSKVNIIPIIAKADTISKSELHKFKIKIMGELVSNGVQIYQFPTDDEAVAEINAVMNAHLPFAVVGSTEEVKVGNKLVRARQYPWGVVQVENENHCDFVKLREMLIRVNMEDLREQTHSRHYELYRRCKLEELGFQDSDGDSQPFSLQETYEAKRKEFLSELQRKEEEMRQMFVNKVKETELELKEKERELHEKFEHLKRVHQEEKRKVEEKRRELEEETSAFNRRKAAVEALQSQALHATSQQPLRKDKDKKKASGWSSIYSVTIP